MKINDVINEGWQDFNPASLLNISGKEFLKALGRTKNINDAWEYAKNSAAVRNLAKYTHSSFINTVQVYKNYFSQQPGLKPGTTKVDNPAFKNELQDLLVKYVKKLGVPLQNLPDPEGNPTSSENFVSNALAKILDNTLAGRYRDASSIESWENLIAAGLLHNERQKNNMAVNQGKKRVLPPIVTKNSNDFGEPIDGEVNRLIDPGDVYYKDAILPIQIMTIEYTEDSGIGIERYIKLDGKWYVDSNDSGMEVAFDDAASVDVRRIIRRLKLQNYDSLRDEFREGVPFPPSVLGADFHPRRAMQREGKQAEYFRILSPESTAAWAKATGRGL